ncbi:hypothetical protein [Lentilactobacillus sp. SPB1-3]|uniref:Uncharacterized protein n=1 Tax=Lentilactobacillus terminaliae TaxID=3003483 RepID=A0ACD5DCZ9_9LACO|nr:hypothetical protein [Lentilactobacillus sp. SPB1-3]MCZ0978006.1 hypothetical protein [Lentilactobacillus sp. SPB1-3]
MERLEEIAGEITKAELEIGDLQRALDNRKEHLNTLNRELVVEMGHATEADTDNYHFKRSIPNPSKQSAYKVSSAVRKEEQERQIAWLKANHPQLIEEQEKVNNKPIRELLADGSFQIADNGKVVDENGEIIPGVFGELKPEKVNVKVLAH